jgi:hypothetical protein
MRVDALRVVARARQFAGIRAGFVTDEQAQALMQPTHAPRHPRAEPVVERVVTPDTSLQALMADAPDPAALTTPKDVWQELARVGVTGGGRADDPNYERVATHVRALFARLQEFNGEQS